MNTHGLINATRRLHGARQMGSCTLTRKAEQEARTVLAQALMWLQRHPFSESPADKHPQISQAVAELQALLEHNHYPKVAMQQWS